MKIQMEPTENVVSIDGVECRIWNAVTDSNVQCFVFVHRIGVRNDSDLGAFEQALAERPDPEALRLIDDATQPSHYRERQNEVTPNGFDYLLGGGGRRNKRG